MFMIIILQTNFSYSRFKIKLQLYHNVLFQMSYNLIGEKEVLSYIIENSIVLFYSL